MTESEWLASEDPRAMLDWLNRETDYRPSVHPAISDRQLCLFACACWDLSRGYPRADERPASVAYGEDGRFISDIHHIVDIWCGPRVWLAKATRASLLREIVGNPWRPAYLGEGLMHTETGAPILWNHHITPTALGIAQAAYDKRERKCERCDGEGDIVTIGAHGQRRHVPCESCKYTGRIDDGTIDPARLAVLSDALEEAGCDCEELLRHLRGERRCSLGEMCGTGKWHPLRGPHVRGCWALDLILGKRQP